MQHIKNLIVGPGDEAKHKEIKINRLCKNLDLFNVQLFVSIICRFKQVLPSVFFKARVWSMLLLSKVLSMTAKG